MNTQLIHLVPGRKCRDRLAQPGAKMDPEGLPAVPGACRAVVKKREPERQGA